MSESIHAVAQRWSAAVRQEGLPTALDRIAADVQAEEMTEQTATAALRLLHQVLLPPDLARLLLLCIERHEARTPDTERLRTLASERARLVASLEASSAAGGVLDLRRQRQALLVEGDRLRRRLHG